MRLRLTASSRRPDISSRSCHLPSRRPSNDPLGDLAPGITDEINDLVPVQQARGA